MTGTDDDRPATHGVRVLGDEAADAGDLREAMGDLAGLVTERFALPELLSHVAAFAVRAIPGADGAGVTLLEVDRRDNMVQVLAASHPFVADRTDRTDRLTEGPERRSARDGLGPPRQAAPALAPGPRLRRAAVDVADQTP